MYPSPFLIATIDKKICTKEEERKNIEDKADDGGVWRSLKSILVVFLFPLHPNSLQILVHSPHPFFLFVFCFNEETEKKRYEGRLIRYEEEQQRTGRGQYHHRFYFGT